MKTTRVFLFVIMSTLVTAATTSGIQRKGASTADAASPVVGIIKNPDAIEGCGCALQLAADFKQKNNRNLFVSDFEGPAIMNIDGKDIKLKLVSRDEGHETGIGSHKYETYAAGKFKVSIDYTVTKVCDPGDESCEITWYSAIITVVDTATSRTKTVKAVGICGC